MNYRVKEKCKAQDSNDQKRITNDSHLLLPPITYTDNIKQPIVAIKPVRNSISEIEFILIYFPRTTLTKITVPRFVNIVETVFFCSVLSTIFNIYVF